MDAALDFILFALLLWSAREQMDQTNKPTFFIVGTIALAVLLFLAGLYRLVT